MGDFKRSIGYFFFKCTIFLCLGILGTILLFLLIVGGRPVFEDEFTAAMPLKYQLLKETDEPKIIIIGGSNAGFGINSELLQKKTGYPVVNLGLHAGFGQLFNTELAKDYINENDIVLLAYEYCFYKDAFDGLGDVDLIMHAIDNHIEMYRAIPINEMPVILGNLLKYLEDKVTKTENATGVYSIESFDERGNMVLNRDSWIVSDDEPIMEISNDTLCMTEKNKEYLIDLRKYIEKRKAKVYFVSPPILKDGVTVTSGKLSEYATSIEKATGIEYISNPEDYIFTKDEMYDTTYHCNSKGEKKRTILLLNELNQVLSKKIIRNSNN